MADLRIAKLEARRKAITGGIDVRMRCKTVFPSTR